MTDFRRWFLAAAAMALLSGLAHAQIGFRSGPANSLFACTATVAGTPQLRPEGYTELLGDILITCTGGPTLWDGMIVPSANVTVYLLPNLPPTSRALGQNGPSEALLIIDDPGSGMPTGATGGYGPQAPQTLCNVEQQENSGCTAFAGADRSGNYQVAVLADGSTPAQNIYQGVTGYYSSNSVTFFGVPVLPPAYQGVSRTFRITNVRFPVAAGLASQQQVSVIVSTSPSTVLPASSGLLAAGVVGASMTASVDPAPAGGGSPFSQCSPTAGARLTARLTFTEGFAAGFKTRVVPLANNAWASTLANTGTPGQNIPGGFYSGFASNNESGFILPAATGVDSVSGITYTAGLADFGTRLKAVFTNIPSGLTLYVSTTNTGGGSYAAPGGTGTTPYAVLVAGGQSNEANNDGPALTPLSGGTVTGSDGLTAYPLTPDGTGTAAAIWEVANSNPAGIDSLTFSVYVGYSGQPQPTGQLGQAVNNVALSFAPEPGGGTFSPVNATYGLTSPEPRFGIVNQQQGSWVAINSCTLSVSEATMPFASIAGGVAPPSQTRAVSINPSNLAVTADPEVTTPAHGTWLSASLSGGTLTISTNPTGLAASATPYAGFVALYATNSPTVILYVPVTLTVTAPSPCDVGANGTVGAADVQEIVDEALGMAPAIHDLNQDGIVNLLEVQIVINAAMGLPCTAK